MALRILGKIIFPFILILTCWLFFEVIEFFRLGGGQQPLAWTIVKISVLSSTIIGIASYEGEQKAVILDNLIERAKVLSIDEK